MRSAIRLLAVGCAFLSAAACSAGETWRSRDDRETIQRRANAGDQQAALTLAGWYRHGHGPAVPRDVSKAVYWYERAGPLGGWGLLGAMYRDGDGVPRDLEQAARYFRQAVEAGYPLAMYELGQLHVDGSIHSRDPVEGYTWLLLAQRVGRSQARCARHVECHDWAIQDRPGYRARMERTLTAEQKAEAERRAAAWLAAHRLAQ